MKLRRKMEGDIPSRKVGPMGESHENTRMFKTRPEDETLNAKDIIINVYEALKEKGYNPINQIVGYLLSGDPAYITSHKSARSLVRRIERDELLEELVRYYLDERKKE